MQVLNLRRAFECLRMKDIETVKEFFDRLLSIMNQIRLLGEVDRPKGSREIFNESA